MGQTEKRRRWIPIVLILILAACLLAAMAGAPSHRAYAAEGSIEDMLGFTYEATVPSGIVVGTDLQNSFSITLHLYGNSVDMVNTTCEYRVAKSIDDSSRDWYTITEKDVNTFSATLRYNSIQLNAPQGVSRYYLYFRTTLPGDDGEEVAYEHPNFYLLIVDTVQQNTIRIEEVQAYFGEEGNLQPYDLSNPQWVSQNVWLRVRLNVDNASGAEGANGDVYYALKGVDDAEEGERTGATPIQIDGYWWHQIVLTQSFEGEVYLYAANGAGTELVSYETAGVQAVRLDKGQPQFEVAHIVEANPDLGIAQREYISGEWAPNTVVFRITPQSDCISGTVYEYSYSTSSSAWTAFGEQNQDQTGDGSYVLRIEESRELVRFRARSNAGVTNSYGVDWNVRIDKNVPELNVSAVDGKGKAIRSMDDESAGESDARAGYASGRLDFTLRNAQLQNMGTSGGSGSLFFYREQGSADWTPINSVDSNYTLAHTTLTPGMTYEFLLRTGAGLEVQRTFTFAVLPGEVEISMDPVAFTPNEAGWVDNEVEVVLNLVRFLGTDDEYRFYRIIGQGGVNAEDVTDRVTLPEGETGGMAKYSLLIDRSFANQTVGFYAVSKAEDVSATVRTPVMSLDLVDPAATVVRQLENGVTLEDDDWSKEHVYIRITPASSGQDGYNISGVSCHLLYSGNVRGDAMTMQDGAYVYQVRESGYYRFVLVSGAGRTFTIERQVNIDTTEITISGLEAFQYDQEGNEVSLFAREPYNNEGKPVSGTVYVRFRTNHAGHFRLYYFDETLAGSYPDDLQAFTLYRGVTDPQGEVETPFESTWLFQFTPSDDNHRVKFAFVLQSKARDGSDNFSQTLPVEVEIFYDVTQFKVGYSVSAGVLNEEWTEGFEVSGLPSSKGIPFTLDLVADETGVVPNVSIARWEVRLFPATGWDSAQNDYTYGLSESDALPWQEIPNSAAQKVHYDFIGLARTYSRNGISLDLGYSFNGYLEFRATSTSGVTSVIRTEHPVLLDNIDITTPDVARAAAQFAVTQSSGERVALDNGGTDYYKVFSREEMGFAPFDYNDPLCLQMAPMTYYYARITSLSETPAETAYTQVSGEVSGLSSMFCVYVMKQVDGSPMGDSTTGMVFQLVHDGTDLAATFNGGTLSAQGVLEFPWSSNVRVTITPRYEGMDADCKLYYEYNLDGGAWIRINADAVSRDEQQIIYFTGSADPGVGMDPNWTITDFNVNAVVGFRLVSQSGQALDVNRVRVRIDTKAPEFGIVARVNGQTVENTDQWQPDAVDIEIVPTADNPSGVRYTYAVNDSGVYRKLPGSGMYFSTDDLVGFADGDGEVKLTILATRNAMLEAEAAENATVSNTVTLRIDRRDPDFDLVGEVDIRGTSYTRSLESGEWTNANAVRLSLIPRTENKSQVTYTYYEDNNVQSVSNWEITADGRLGTLERSSLMTVHVIATTQSNRVVERSFDIKIDNEAPVIHSGRIVNSADPNRPNRYYVDQVITYDEPNLKSAYYNNFPLTNGQIIATNTVDNSNGGLVHIVIEDMAGNISELTFYMTIFDLTVNTITLSSEDRALLSSFESDFEAARDTLTQSRQAYFSTTIGRLYDRIAMLEKQRDEYRAYLELVNARGETAFELRSDYAQMEQYINYFETTDTLVRYPDWLQQTITEGVYAQYYAKLKNAFERLRAQMEQVRRIENSVIALPAINLVARTDYESILRVYGDYNSMTTDQQSVFTTTLYTKLLELKRCCEVLLLQDPDTNISIDGEDLAAGATITVNEYDRSSELFNNAQMTVMETIPEGGSRALIYIVNIGLEGNGSQQQTGRITITLPIPEEYRNYIYFAVYRLSASGTISQVENVTINGDGESLYFESDSLDTYILATTAVVSVRPPSEKIYGKVGEVEIDATMLTYITFAAVGLFVLLLLVLIIVGVRHRVFLNKYDRAHRNTLLKRGLSRIPRGNTLPAANPAHPEERVDQNPKYYMSKKPKLVKEPKPKAPKSKGKK